LFTGQDLRLPTDLFTKFEYQKIKSFRENAKVYRQEKSPVNR